MRPSGATELATSSFLKLALAGTIRYGSSSLKIVRGGRWQSVRSVVTAHRHPPLSRDVAQPLYRRTGDMRKGCLHADAAKIV
ncbi:uncharacterized protein K489DRAFT_133455 [Dissoconium aciculare CBS 342.82]|uniref:Uncharacterized protein n=1 Tax=Dissoconium aciculare CBS 342.82 TaxID=1314786 RepID=A0A6J3LS72_9PEZI|nr:uncharacterized protein K489DRAFT_133455 [Dissoconium aciculare CBS 342.82]KAF1818139.1 hypothetical protein K489DRAFT_133455 [Dissoconium aciculare CBS 342.82]